MAYKLRMTKYMNYTDPRVSPPYDIPRPYYEIDEIVGDDELRDCWRLFIQMLIRIYKGI